MSAGITFTGSYIPKKKIDNNIISKKLKLSKKNNFKKNRYKN